MRVLYNWSEVPGAVEWPGIQQVVESSAFPVSGTRVLLQHETNVYAGFVSTVTYDPVTDRAHADVVNARIVFGPAVPKEGATAFAPIGTSTVTVVDDLMVHGWPSKHAVEKYGLRPPPHAASALHELVPGKGGGWDAHPWPRSRLFWWFVVRGDSEAVPKLRQDLSEVMLAVEEWGRALHAGDTEAVFVARERVRAIEEKPVVVPRVRVRLGSWFMSKRTLRALQVYQNDAVSTLAAERAKLCLEAPRRAQDFAQQLSERGGSPA